MLVFRLLTLSYLSPAAGTRCVRCCPVGAAARSRQAESRNLLPPWAVQSQCSNGIFLLLRNALQVEDPVRNSCQGIKCQGGNSVSPAAAPGGVGHFDKHNHQRLCRIPIEAHPVRVLEPRFLDPPDIVPACLGQAQSSPVYPLGHFRDSVAHQSG